MRKLWVVGGEGVDIAFGAPEKEVEVYIVRRDGAGGPGHRGGATWRKTRWMRSWGHSGRDVSVGPVERDLL